MEQITFSQFIQDNEIDFRKDFLEYNFQSEEEFNRLRTEATNDTFRKRMIKKLGTRCGNCGSKENVEYHHIVPLRLGGTNKLTNIVPLCTRCHDIVHGCKYVRNSSIIRGKAGGRPKRILPEEYQEIMDSYIFGTIGRREVEEKLFGSGKKIYDENRFKQRVKEHNIIRFFNHIDLNRCKRYKSVNMQNKRIEIWYADGTYYCRLENGFDWTYKLTQK